MSFNKTSVFKTHDGTSLTCKQYFLIKNYVKYRDYRKAALEAGYSDTPNTAHVAWETLNKPHIRKELEYQLGIVSDQLDLDIARIVTELNQIGLGIQKDPFGFEIAPSDKIGALKELIKFYQTHKAEKEGKSENTLTVKLVRDYSVIPKEIKPEEDTNDSSTE